MESKRRKPRSFVYATIKVEKISENCFGLNLLRQKNSRSEHIHIMLSCESFKCNIKITPLILRHKYQLNRVSNGWFVLQYKANFPISVQQRGNRFCLSPKIYKWTKQKFVLTWEKKYNSPRRFIRKFRPVILFNAIQIMLSREQFRPLPRTRKLLIKQCTHQRFDTETLISHTRPHREVSGLKKKTSRRKCCIYKVVPKATFCNFDFACCKTSRRDIDQHLENKGERLKP